MAETATQQVLGEPTETTEQGLIVVSKEFGGGRTVESLAEAAEFLGRRISHSWNITMPTEQDVRAVVEEDGLEKSLQIIYPEDFYPQYQNFLPLAGDEARWTIQHGDYHEGVVFDRNLAWIDLSANNPSTATFGVVSEHGLSEAALLQEMTGVAAKINQFVGAVLLDEPTPPYAH